MAQATVGGLVAKTLTASTANPYTSPGYSVGAPAALDAFSIQVRLAVSTRWPVFDIVTGEPFKQSAELTGEPIKMKG